MSEGHHVVDVVKVDGSPYTLTFSLMKEGSKGESVRWLQYELNQHGANLETDGIFGKKTKLAVLLFQKDHQKDFNLVMDGETGKNTINALKKLAKYS